jgi:hypothetical protein
MERGKKGGRGKERGKGSKGDRGEGVSAPKRERRRAKSLVISILLAYWTLSVPPHTLGIS